MLNFANSYFELFGIPEHFEVDMAYLAERYLVLQQVVHPDRHANAPDQERRLALQEAGLVNEALRTLKDPLARGSYMLARRGFTAATNSTIDPSFLMEHLELREALEEAQYQPEPYHAILIVTDKLRKQREALIHTLAHALDADHLIQAQEALHKLQFLNRLQRRVEEMEARLDERV